MVMEHHEIPFGVWLAISTDDEPVAHWFILQDPSRVDVLRNATKAVLASEIAQAVHEHTSGDMCQRECRVLLPGPATGEKQ